MKSSDLYSKVKVKLSACKSFLNGHRLLVMRILVPLAILVFGVLVVLYMVETSPKSERKVFEKQARLVEVVSLERVDVPITISAMGTVKAAQQVELKPQVSGKIIEVESDLIPGGLFSEGQRLMRIEPDDYELLIEERKSGVANARSNLKIEYGNQQVAREEYELLGEVITESDRELVLREPQLAAAKAALGAAESQLKQAELDLERTNIKAPFNAIVNDKYVDLGAMVSMSNALVNLTCTDEYWVELAIPVDKLKWIEIPLEDNDVGSEVKIYNTAAWGKDAYRVGRVIRLRPDIEARGRMAKVLVCVKDPLGLKDCSNNLLLIDSYVRAEIEGVVVKSVFMLDRSLLRNDDQVWVFAKDKSLRIQNVKVLYRGENYVLVSNGISSGDKIVTTDISAPVEGMALRLRGGESEAAENQALSNPSGI